MPDAQALTGSESTRLLALWERGLGHTGATRADVMLQVYGGMDAAPRTLGERNLRLLEVHARLFGQELELLSHCRSCGAAAQFSLDCRALAARMPAVGDGRSYQVEIEGHLIEFRLPDAADLVDASQVETEDAFVARLLERCVLACTRDSAHVAVRDVPEPVLDGLSRHMETLDPAARVSFAVECPHCSAGWDARLDIDQLVWARVQAAAERLLLEVDSLARAYGWTEREVLELNPLRRAAYLQLVNG
jgi:hypothetical protein